MRSNRISMPAFSTPVFRAGLRPPLCRIGHPRFTHGRIPCLLLLLVVVLIFCPAARAQSQEYRAKANFLAAFPNFIDWPDSAFSSDRAPLVLCVFGDFSFGTALAELTRASLFHGRRVEVRWTHQEQELRACHVLFLSRSQAPRYAKILKIVQGANVLTVGETPDFLAIGGAIEFLIQDDRLRFAVNMASADEAHLRISSNMLALANHIVRDQAAKVGVVSRSETQVN